MAPRILTTWEWGAFDADVSQTRRPARGIVIHHTASANRAPLEGDAELEPAIGLARAIQNSHVYERHWGDTGQHFTVSKGGIILEGRHGSLAAAILGQVIPGAHAGNLEANLYHWGIETEGDYTDASEVIPDAQWRALVSLVDWLLGRGSLPSNVITPHRQWNATGCPGHLADRIPYMARAVSKRRALRVGGASVVLAGIFALARELGRRVVSARM